MIKCFLLFIICLPSVVFGAHIVGGEIYYDCLGGNNYMVTVKLYRDCNSGGANFDPNLPLSIFDGNNNIITTEFIPFPGSTNLPLIFDNPCITPPTGICRQEAIYQKTITLPTNVNGFTLSYQRCCRGPNVVNLLNPDDTGLTLTTSIPSPATGAICNSSPRFNNFPPLVVCNNEELVFDHSATDPDGDDIVYELCAPFAGGSSALPNPTPAAAPPYVPVNYETGFSADSPFGATGPTAINDVTGQLNSSPLNLGSYVVGVCAKEYRNGVLLSTTRRDFLFKVINCNISLQAAVTAQEDLGSFVSYCQGLTIDFENTSFGGTNYLWDFGVDNETTDISSEYSPSFTFPAEGTYEVTLVVNPGWTCTDTSTQSFTVFNQIDASFPALDSQCITNNSFDFIGEGNYDVNQSIFTWDFGGNATPLVANTETVNNVQFNTSGNHIINYTVNWNLCNASYTDTIFIFSEPTINFYVDPELKCAPYRAEFIDSSTANAPIEYLWTFGDGSTSTIANPSNIYDTPGLYDVTLNIQVNQGCVADLTLQKPDIIDVKPTPNSSFIVSPSVTDIFNTLITFEDTSEEGVEHYYYFNDTSYTEDRNTTWSYLEGGNHRPYQLLINEFGCRDSSFQLIYVSPLTTIYVPNSFTPNQDGTNDIFLPIVFDVAEYTLDIYDRWGQIIYTSNNRKIGWNGTLGNNKPAKDGIYTWHIQYTNSVGVREEHRGHVNLLK